MHFSATALNYGAKLGCHLPTTQFYSCNLLLSGKLQLAKSFLLFLFDLKAQSANFAT